MINIMEEDNRTELEIIAESAEAEDIEEEDTLEKDIQWIQHRNRFDGTGQDDEIDCDML